jgi:hypothetical protein
VVGHLLGDLELAAVAQVLGDAGSSETVARDACAFSWPIGRADNRLRNQANRR